MLHDPKVQTEPFTYEDVNEWWRGQGVCINGSWRKFDKALKASAETKKASPNNSTEEKADNSESASVDVKDEEEPKVSLP